MYMIKLTVNGKEFAFVNESINNRSGFKHHSNLFDNNGNLLSSAKIQYYNRTWECYRFQSSMLTAVDNKIDEEKEKFKDNFKRKNNIKRLTKSKKEAMEKEFLNTEVYLTLKEVRKKVYLGELN